MASNITLAVTSCGRHDLLKQTLESFCNCTDIPPQQTIIIEDGDIERPDWLNERRFRDLGPVTWINNGIRMGQIYSIDRLYQEITTDYIFHCEDDWLFTEQGFMSPSLEILKKHPEIWTVSLRGNDCNGHTLVTDPRYPFKIHEPYWRGGWGGCHFNPGLRRLSDYKRIGSYGRHTAYGTHGLGHELQLSKMHLDMGYRIAVLPQIHVVHTGGGRSRAIEPLPSLPKVLIAVPACHKFEYSKWESEQSPHYDPTKAYNGQPYGTDIHISGENDRIQAVRDTWFRDIEPFKDHVTGKFFYGEPHPRPALSDEVYIPCPDDYESLPLKTIEICRYALREGYDYIFKCDDDTAVYVDRLIKELLEHRFDYAGYEHSGVCTGGPGYWLSKRAMKAVSEFKPYHWAEDVTVGHALTEARIRAVMLPGHRPGFSAHWFFNEGFDPKKLTPDIVTMHAVQPEIMPEWYAHERGK